MPGPDAKNLPTPQEDHALILEAVREAGAIAMKFYQSDFEIWDKKPGDVVTEADLAIDEMLHAKLRSARPSYGWLSEETEDDPERLDAKRVWVVDPIDGTRAFSKGKPHFTVCIAMVEDGVPLAAAVYNPATDELFEAIAGGGARRNDHPIAVSDCEDMTGCRMLAYGPMFSHPAWPEPWPTMHVETRNSIAYRLVLVAGGAFDAAVALNSKHDWDLAAAHLIVEEAGGLITQHDGENFIYNRKNPTHRSVICAGPALYRRIFERVGPIKLP